MDIHKPKPWHGLREFLKEYVIIVVGVLTALAAESGVEWLHWRHAVAEARAALHEEIAGQTRFYQIRVSLAPCVDRHIAAMQGLIDSAARDSHTAGVRGVALRLGQRLDIGEWTAEEAAQTLVHVPRKERSLLATFYRQTQDMMAWRDEETRAWDELSVLDGAARRTSEPELAQLRARLKRAEHLEALISSNAVSQLDRARRLGVRAPTLDENWRDRCHEITPTG
jgi:hypothetical protein